MSDGSPSAPSTEAGTMFELGEEHIDGALIRVFKHAPRSLRAIWDTSAAHGDAVYLVYEDERHTYAEVRSIVASLARRLVDDLGVSKGDRVAIAMRNYPEWALSFWAAATAGAIIVPLNAWWTGPELAYGIKHSGSQVLIADGERLERVAPHLKETDVRSVIAARGDHVEPGHLSFSELAAVREGDALPDVDISPDDDALIMYTSGTTGRPKGAVGTHRNIGNQMMNAMYAAAAGLMGLEEAATGRGAATPAATLLTFPLFHVGGLHSVLIPYTILGGKVVLLYKWDASRALDLIEREEISAVAGVPTTMLQLLDEAKQQDRALTSLAGVASGATLVPPELVRRIDRQLEARAAPANGYGLTETSGAATVNTGRQYLERPDSVGTPISPAMAVRVAGPEGEDLSADEVGEIWLRGPTVFRGYYEDPAATAAAITDGWFHTGDAGRLDNDGYLYVVDRFKDVIIRGGENIYAAEVEAALYEHPDVTEAAIIGAPDERLGEQVAAVVRLRTGSTADVEALRAHVGQRLASFKVPTIVHLTGDELPRNAAGKVLKRELRDMLASAPSATS